MVERLSLTFKVLTPLYLGGAGQEAELRPPSFKGLLRYWSRAIDPTCLGEKEAAIFGGTGKNQGQAPFFLTMDTPLKGDGRWDDSLVRGFDTRGTNNMPQNGLRYLGYPFQLNDKQRIRQGGSPRSCIKPGTEFSLICIFPRAPNREIKRALAASVWLLGHLGGAGSRSRRGFGALALMGWKIQGGNPWAELKQLPLLHNETTPESWMAGYKKMRLLLNKDNWFPKTENPFRHPYFNTESTISHSDAKRTILVGKNAYPLGEWAACLNEMGLAMQRFRQLRQPDYSQVKTHLQGQGVLSRSPDRASFGLPLTFRYRSLNGKSVTLVSKDGDRHGSLLHLRPALVGDRLYPLYLRLAGDVPGQTPGAKIHGWNNPLAPLENNLMDEFMKQLQGVIQHG